LAPKAQLGEFFGLAGLFARIAAILGPLLWGLIVWDPTRYHYALLMLVGLLAVGLWLLRGVPPVSPGRA
jgi:MFS-type transporter involved in bile tolerance (Atg22 family)